MSATAQYVVVMVVYFAGMLLIGALANRRIKSSKDYFIARGNFGPALIGFSYSATQISGSSYMGAVGTEKMLGYNFSPAGVASAAAPWFSYVLLGTRLRKLAAETDSLTITDVFRSRYYSKSVGVLCTAIMLTAFVPMIAAQLKAGANVFEAIFGMPYFVGLLLFGGIVIFYTVLGGMFAVAWTDFVQGIIMLAGFAILAPVAVSAAGGFAEMNRQYGALNPKAVLLVGKMSGGWVVSSFLVWGFFQIGGSPHSVTKFLIPKDDKTLKGAMVYSVLFQSFIYVCATLVAISSGVILPDLPVPDLTVPVLVAKLLPPAIGAIIITAIVAAMMSTISSILLMSGSLVFQDIYKVRKGAVGPGVAMKVSRRVTLGIGIAGALIALHPPAPILWIVTMSFSLLASAFTFPFLLGVWWKGATREGAIAAILSGAISCVVWYFLGYMRYESFDNWVGGIWPAIIGSGVSLATILVISRFTPKPPREVLAVFFEEEGVNTVQTSPRTT